MTFETLDGIRCRPKPYSESDQHKIPISVVQIVKYVIAFAAGCLFWFIGSGLQNWGTQ